MTYPILKILKYFNLSAFRSDSSDRNSKSKQISNKLGIKQLMAGGGIIILAQTVIPLLSGLFGGGEGGGGE